MKIYEKSTNELSAAYLIYESPVRCETPELMGISHLLEHMMCISLDDHQELFDRHGLTFNAYTGSNEVCYYLSGLESELALFRDLMIHRITNYVPTHEDFEKELQIVTQEYRDAYGSPAGAMFKNYLSARFGEIGPIGTIEALENITFEQVVEFHKKVFAKPTKFIYVGQNEYSPEIEFGEVQAPTKHKARNINNDVPPNPNSLPVFLAGEEVEADDLYLMNVILAMLDMGLSSPMYKRLREEKKLCYGIGGEAVEINQKMVPFIVTSVSHEKADEALTEMLNVLGEYKTHMTEDRFNLIMQNLRVRMRMSLQNPITSASQKHLLGNAKKFSVVKNIDTITYEDVMKFYDRAFNPANVEWKQYTHFDVLKM